MKTLGKRLIDSIRTFVVCCAMICIMPITNAFAACNADQIDAGTDGCKDVEFSVTTTNDATELFFTLSAKGTFYVDCGTGGTLSTFHGTGISARGADGVLTVPWPNLAGEINTNECGEVDNYATVANKKISKNGTTVTGFRCSYTGTGTHEIRFGESVVDNYKSINNNNIPPTIAFGLFRNSDESSVCLLKTHDKVASVSGDLSALLPTNTYTENTQPMFGDTFNSCSNLTTISDDLFNGISVSKTNQFRMTFYNCSNLRSVSTQNGDISYIPKSMFNTLIDNNTNNSNKADFLWRTFQGTGLDTSCGTGLTQIGYDNNYYGGNATTKAVCQSTSCAAGEFYNNGTCTSCQDATNGEFTLSEPGASSIGDCYRTELASCDTTSTSLYTDYNAYFYTGNNGPIYVPSVVDGCSAYELGQKNGPIDCKRYQSGPTNAPDDCNTFKVECGLVSLSAQAGYFIVDGSIDGAGSTLMCGPCQGNTYQPEQKWPDPSFREGGDPNYSSVVMLYCTQCPSGYSAINDHTACGANVVLDFNGGTGASNILSGFSIQPLSIQLTANPNDPNNIQPRDQIPTIAVGNAPYNSSNQQISTIVTANNGLMPIKQGYQFNGFWTEPTGGTQIISPNGTFVNPTNINIDLLDHQDSSGNYILYAQYVECSVVNDESTTHIHAEVTRTATEGSYRGYCMFSVKCAKGYRGTGDKPCESQEMPGDSLGNNQYSNELTVSNILSTTLSCSPVTATIVYADGLDDQNPTPVPTSPSQYVYGMPAVTPYGPPTNYNTVTGNRIFTGWKCTTNDPNIPCSPSEYGENKEISIGTTDMCNLSQITLTAQWEDCPTGQVTTDHRTCGSCDDREYYDATTGTCKSCPAGYTSDTGDNGNINRCYKTQSVNCTATNPNMPTGCDSLTGLTNCCLQYSGQTYKAFYPNNEPDNGVQTTVNCNNTYTGVTAGPGYHVDPASGTQCSACPTNTVQTNHLFEGTSCRACKIGEFYNNGTCTSCQTATDGEYPNSELGASSINDCYVDKQGTCTSNPPVPPENCYAVVTQEENCCVSETLSWYREYKNQSRVYLDENHEPVIGSVVNDTDINKQCYNRYYTVSATRGHYVYTSESGEQTCPPCPAGTVQLKNGFTGDSCGSCPADQYYSNNKCWDCPRDFPNSDEGDNGKRDKCYAIRDTGCISNPASVPNGCSSVLGETDCCAGRTMPQYREYLNGDKTDINGGIVDNADEPITCTNTYTNALASKGFHVNTSTTPETCTKCGDGESQPENNSSATECTRCPDGEIPNPKTSVCEPVVTTVNLDLMGGQNYGGPNTLAIKYGTGIYANSIRGNDITGTGIGAQTPIKQVNNDYYQFIGFAPAADGGSLMIDSNGSFPHPDNIKTMYTDTGPYTWYAQYAPCEIQGNPDSLNIDVAISVSTVDGDPDRNKCKFDLTCKTGYTSSTSCYWSGYGNSNMGARLDIRSNPPIQCTKAEFQIEYDDGVSGQDLQSAPPAPTSYEVGATDVAVPNNTYVRNDNYIFKNWACTLGKSKKCSKNLYNPGDILGLKTSVTPSCGSTSVIKLTAQWEECPAGSVPNSTHTQCDKCECDPQQPEGRICTAHIDNGRCWTELTCEPGYEPDGPNCRPCQAGTASPDGLRCEPCTGNTYSGARASYCPKCKKNTLANPEHTQCDKCECTPPEHGFCTSVPDITTGTCAKTLSCEDGYVLNGEQCDKCECTNIPENGYCDARAQDGQCVKTYGCNAGYAWDGSTCNPCPAGTYGADGEACLPCQDGYYNPDEGKASCSRCKNGLVNPERTQCDKCECTPPEHGFCTSVPDIATGRCSKTLSCEDGYVLNGEQCDKCECRQPANGFCTAEIVNNTCVKDYTCEEGYTWDGQYCVAVPYGIKYVLSANGAFESSASHPTTAVYDQQFTVDNPVHPNATFNGWTITNMEQGMTHYYGRKSTTKTSIKTTSATDFKNLRRTSATDIDKVVFTANWNCNAGYAGENCDPVVSGKITLDSALYKSNTTTRYSPADIEANPKYVYSKYNVAIYTDVNLTNTIARLTTLPEKTGYVFNGFYTTKAKGGEQVVSETGDFLYQATIQVTQPDADATWYARWTPAEFYVNYDCNGGNEGVTPPSEVVKYAQSFTTAENTCAKGNYLFTGWKIAGTDIVLSENETVLSWTYTSGQDVDLIAQWTWNAFDVILDKNADDATPGTTSVMANYGERLPSGITLPIRPGYRFDGYYDIDGVAYYDFEGTPVLEWPKLEGGILYAKWLDCGAGYYCTNHGYRYRCLHGTTIGFGAGADEPDDCGHILHVGDNKLYMRANKKTDHSLNVLFEDGIYYGNASLEPVKMSHDTDGKLRIQTDSGPYYIYDDSAQ